VQNLFGESFCHGLPRHYSCAHFRFLAGRSTLKDLEELGMSEEHRQQIVDILNSPTGIVLIGGITGSGKSSTMKSQKR
jgi:type II secretory ATPase GspE/PulE/Tfp pilus assembly ATPase PilB-like protein